jgi:hypothetical protein
MTRPAILAPTRRAAERISYPEGFRPDCANKDPLFWAKVLHFGSRYPSVDQLIDDLDIGNFLELSSGYSFRGLEKARNGARFSIDADLPEVIEKKKDMLRIANLHWALREGRPYELIELLEAYGLGKTGQGLDRADELGEIAEIVACRQYYGDIALLPYPPRGLEAIELAREPIVHEDEIGALALFGLEGGLTCGDDGAHLIAGEEETALEIEGDEGLVLDKEDPEFGRHR